MVYQHDGLGGGIMNEDRGEQDHGRMTCVEIDMAA